MRLSDFILDHMESILREWETFAASLLPAADGLDSLALRDHARQILEAIAKDLNTPQTRHEQSEKSKGHARKVEGAPETAAQTHAVLRAQGGFDINQLVAEYRALRASVLRLRGDFKPLDEIAIQDMIRFNEAIDQAIAESVGHFHRTVERYRNLLLGMMGHDLRNPLSAIVMTARHLSQLQAGREISEAAAVLVRSGKAMQALLDDLTDFNRTNLGLGLKIIPSEVDLASAANEELEQFRAAHPGRIFELASSGNTRGIWDGVRVQQLLRNLVSNAILYGAPDMPIRVSLRGEESDIRLEVGNIGHMDPSEVSQIFDPLRRGTASRTVRESREGLGLGLFIVREIARAHGGDVGAHNDGKQTIFAVRLPRLVPPAAI